VLGNKGLIKYKVEFEVLKTVKMSMLVFQVVTPYKLVDRHQHFGETYCLYLHGKIVRFTWAIVTDHQRYNVKWQDGYVRFQVITVASMKTTAFWGMLPTNMCDDSYLWWRRQYTPLKRRPTFMRMHGAISQKAVTSGLRTYKAALIPSVKYCLTLYLNWEKRQREYSEKLVCGQWLKPGV
jgi:hypothetical protein